MAERKRETAAGFSTKVASVKVAATATPKAGAGWTNRATGATIQQDAPAPGAGGMVATPVTHRAVRSASRGSSKSPTECKTPDPAANLSAKLGGMVLMEKEAQGFVFTDPEPAFPKDSRWSAVGKVCSPRRMNFTALNRTLHRAWGLHKEAKFRPLGGNIFGVHFGCEGDWKHVMNNGPWQFDFNVVILKNYEGDTRPSEMVFDNIDIWVRVHDLPPARRTEVFGKALGNWLGEIVRVDCDNEGIARCAHLRVRAKIFVHEPLVRGFYLKTSLEDKVGTWYDFLYEKVPHFCFQCGRLVHMDGICEPPVDSGAQWGGWLRASPGKSKAGKEYEGGQEPSKNSSSGAGWTGDSEDGSFNHSGGRREAPTKRNLSADFLRSMDSRTGVGLRTDRGEENSQLRRTRNSPIVGEGDLRQGIEQRREHDLRGKLMEQRQHGHGSGVESSGNKGKASMSEPCTNFARRDTRLSEGATRKKGTYVKKARLDHTSLNPGSSYAASLRVSRKRGPK
ncbi:hypothetical protein ZWY2020_025979 [Hordeum vulgare]|nr:hypothetical protein ZWY2020_025979 [Hordeum vulgare]